MYKKQLGFQKIICLLAIIAAGVWFVYSLGMITDIHDSLRFVANETKPENAKVAGANLYYDMQPFNKNLQNVSIVMILLACLLYVTNTPSRRKYYIGNYVATGLYSVASLVLAVWAHINVDAFRTQFLTTVDFEGLKAISEILKTVTYTESTLMLDLHWVPVVLSVLVAAGLIWNAVWKTQLMRGEQELIEAGKENGKEAAV